MTVLELINVLKTMNPSALVVMSSDGEGNTYSPISDLNDGYKYAADSPWRGDVGFGELTDELIAAGYAEEDIIEGVDAVVLYPTN